MSGPCCVQVTKNHIALRQQVINTLLYFDIFDYPLNAEEVFKFLQTNSTTQSEVRHCLDALTEKKNLFRFGDLYSLQPDIKNITRRIKGNTEAEKWLQVASKKSQFIAKFPYVRAVMASGSLSKGYMDEESDLDFFIVTAPNRLWIARTLLVLYKRFFLMNSHKQFCVNYFVDSTHLEIEEKNLFTATELITLIPLHDHKYYLSLLDSNAWIKNVFPNFRPRDPQHQHNIGSHAFRNVLEVLLHPLAFVLDRILMQMTQVRWNKIYGKKYSKTDFDIAFKTRRHVSKNHPKFYQKKILDLYQRKLLEYEGILGK